MRVSDFSIYERAILGSIIVAIEFLVVGCIKAEPLVRSIYVVVLVVRIEIFVGIVVRSIIFGYVGEQ